MKSQRFDKYKGKYLRETEASQSLSSLIQDSFMILVQLVLRGGRVKFAHGYNWRASFNIKPFDFDNNVSHTKRNVSYFSAKKHRLHDQISANSNHMNKCIMGILKEIRAGGVNVAKGSSWEHTAPPFLCPCSSSSLYAKNGEFQIWNSTICPQPLFIEPSFWCRNIAKILPKAIICRINAPWKYCICTVESEFLTFPIFSK